MHLLYTCCVCVFIILYLFIRRIKQQCYLNFPTRRCQLSTPHALSLSLAIIPSFCNMTSCGVVLKFSHEFYIFLITFIIIISSRSSNWREREREVVKYPDVFFGIQSMKFHLKIISTSLIQQ